MINGLQKKQYLMFVSSYLSELETLTGRNISREDLLPLKELEVVREQSKVIDEMPLSRFELDFADKESTRFSDFIVKLHESCNKPFFIWTEKSNTCGLYQIDNLLQLDLGFPFEINPEGIIQVIAVDFSNLIVFDFSLESPTKKLLEIETQGTEWAAVVY